jgi:hypothetical protein
VKSVIHNSIIVVINVMKSIRLVRQKHHVSTIPVKLKTVRNVKTYMLLIKDVTKTHVKMDIGIIIIKELVYYRNQLVKLKIVNIVKI